MSSSSCRSTLNNIAKHPGEPRLWLATVFVASILIAVGLNLMVSARFAKRA